MSSSKKQHSYTIQPEVLKSSDVSSEIEGLKLSISARIYSQDSSDFDRMNYQYCTSTQAIQGRDDHQSPGLIIYPGNIQDVVSVVKYARRNDKAIAIRTGGHSYNQASTTSSKNILIDLSETFPDKEYIPVRNEVRFGVSNNLLDFHKFLERYGLFLPHGYAGNVFLGGHAQTGGIGSLCRSFGLLIDHIVRMEIVDANGEIRLITKETDNGDYFFALLGANNGNFGIVTHIVFTPLRDADYPKSKAIRIVVPYSKEILQKYYDFAMKMSKVDIM
jgi:FAD/FMN-containing dehydrogenase